MNVKDEQAEIRRLSAKRRALKAAPPGVAAEVQGHKRLTLSEIVQLLLQRGRSASGGVTLSRNARGIPQFEVSVPTGEECPTIDTAKEKAVAVYEELEARFPFYETPAGEK